MAPPLSEWQGALMLGALTPALWKQQIFANDSAICKRWPKEPVIFSGVG